MDNIQEHSLSLSCKWWPWVANHSIIMAKNTTSSTSPFLNNVLGIQPPPSSILPSSSLLLSPLALLSSSSAWAATSALLALVLLLCPPQHSSSDLRWGWGVPSSSNSFSSSSTLQYIICTSISAHLHHLYTWPSTSHLHL